MSTEHIPRDAHSQETPLPGLEKEQRPESTTQTVRSESPEKTEDTVEENKPVNPWADPSSFPDGGAKAWLTVAGGACCLFVSFGWINCVGVFQVSMQYKQWTSSHKGQEYYQRNQLHAYSSSEIAWIPSLQGRCLSFAFQSTTN